VSRIVPYAYRRTGRRRFATTTTATPARAKQREQRQQPKKLAESETSFHLYLPLYPMKTIIPTACQVHRYYAQHQGEPYAKPCVPQHPRKENHEMSAATENRCNSTLRVAA
jgi:hypothetical protein